MTRFSYEFSLQVTNLGLLEPLGIVEAARHVEYRQDEKSTVRG